MSEPARAAVLDTLCRELRLPNVRHHQHDPFRQGRTRRLGLRCIGAWAGRSRSPGPRNSAVARLLRQARFPDHKTLELLDWDVLRGIGRPQLAQLATCDYIERGEDVVIAGPIGTCKAHLAITLGVEVVQRR